MKIFITGIAGFLGSHMADRLLTHTNVEIAGNDNLIGGEEKNVPRGVDFTQADCRDFDAMVEALQGVDVVVHTAATAHEGLSVFSPSFITKNIFEASVTMMSAAIAAGVTRFVFCSSMARYGNQASPFTEDMTPKPVDPYGIAKVAAEDVLKTLSEVHGMEWNIAVPHNIIGARQRYDDPFRNVLSIMLNRSLQGKPVYIYGDGNQVRCFSPVEECVDSLLELVINKDIVSETVNIGPDSGEITINELSKLVALETGSDLDPIYVDPRPQEVYHATCSAEKARKLLNYQNTTPVKQAIKDTADFIRENGTRDFDYSFPLEIVTDKTPITWKERMM